MTWPRQPNISIQVAKAIGKDVPITVTWESNGPVTIAAGGVTLRRIPPAPAPWWARFWPWYKIVVLYDLPRCTHCKGAGQCSEGEQGWSCAICTMEHMSAGFVGPGYHTAHAKGPLVGIQCCWCKGTGKERMP